MERTELPRPGIDYPQTFAEFDAWFRTEKACRDYLARLRWPDGFNCPHCGRSGRAWTTGRELLHCQACQGQTSVTAGTIFDGTRKPLRTWFLAMWFVTSQKHGVSALGLQRVLGLGSYQTAWAWLHKLRRAMVRPDRDRLSGEVEVDETYVGGLEEGAVGRGTKTKAIVAVTAEKEGKAVGRIRLACVPDVSSDSLLGFVEATVAPGSLVHTDGWVGYARLEDIGYRHRVTNLMGSRRPAHQLLPRVHHVASLLKRWLLGTHHGGVQVSHLPYYLDEFTFRFNRRRSRARGLLFHRLAQQAVAVDAVPLAQLRAVSGSTAKRP